MNRLVWIAAASAAAAVLIALALIGERPATHVSVFVAAGVMRHILPAEVDQVDITSGAKRWQFLRRAGKWEASSPGHQLHEGTTGAIERGLLLLHNSAPERTLTAEEASGAFGLESPALTVALKGRESFSIAFGDSNPLGLARYARIEGHLDVVLLPRFVADAWQDVVNLQAQ